MRNALTYLAKWYLLAVVTFLGMEEFFLTAIHRGWL